MSDVDLAPAILVLADALQAVAAALVHLAPRPPAPQPSAAPVPADVTPVVPCPTCGTLWRVQRRARGQ